MERFIIDAFGWAQEDLEKSYPVIFQQLLVSVKPMRDQSSRKGTRERWWEFAEPRKRLRRALHDIERYITTIETSKHRFFVFKPSNHVADHKLVCIASRDAFHLGVLSSEIHVTWTLQQGSRLEDRPVYVQTTCFETFPFPALEEGELKTRIRELGERLDAHRKARQAAHPDLTLTGMYNVLEKLRAEEPLSDKEKKIHDEGLVTVLKQIHDDLDAAVFEAYGWEDLYKEKSASGLLRSTEEPERSGDSQRQIAGDDMTKRPEARFSIDWEQELLTRLVALNHERAAEEKRGLVRWLRPEYQAPEEAKAKDIDLPMEVEQKSEDIRPSLEKLNWPKGTAAQFAEVTKLLPATGPDPETISAAFGKKSKARTNEIREIIETLKSLGKLG